MLNNAAPAVDSYEPVIRAAIEAARRPWYERPPWSFAIGGAIAVVTGVIATAISHAFGFS